MKHTHLGVIILSIMLLLCSCNENKSTTKNYAAMNNDSCIIVGLLPTLDCIPFYIARERGIYDSLGINVKFLYLNSQMDMDVALAKGKVDLGTNDILRTIILQNKHKNVRFLQSSSRQWQLFANKKIRIRKTEQLNDRMLAITRQSVLDYYCDTIEAQIKKGILLKPQINNVHLRLRMLNEHQVDAAILPVPVTEQAALMGHTSLQTVTCCNGWGGFAVNCKKIGRHKTADIQKLIQGYNQAAKSLAGSTELTLAPAMQKLFNTDTIPHFASVKKLFKPLSNTSSAQIEKAYTWAKNKKYLQEKYTTDTLLYKLP